MTFQIYMRNILQNTASQAMETVKAAKAWILAAALVYVLAGGIAWSFPHHFDFLEPQFHALVEQFAHLGAWEFILRIFVHNLIASYLAMCFIVFFGVVPVAFAVLNGLLLGWFVSWMEEAAWYEILVMLAPHGIFEWPAMFIAFGVGFWRGWGYRYGQANLTWLQRFKRVHCVFVVFVLPLLCVAAVIEGRYHLAGVAA